MMEVIDISREIPLTHDKFAIVDDDDYEWLMNWKWWFHHKGYAVRHKILPNGKRKHVSMHRLIMHPPDNMVIDHINGDKLDNRKCNFEFALKVIIVRIVLAQKTRHQFIREYLGSRK